MPFKKRLQDLEVPEKASATFQCEVPVPAMESAWYKEETRLWASAKYLIEEAGTERRLTVLNVSSDDDAVYICETAEGSRTVAELAVQGKRAAGQETGQGMGLPGPGRVTEVLGGGAGRIPGQGVGQGEVERELWTQGQEGGVGGAALWGSLCPALPASPSLTAPLPAPGNLLRKLPRKTAVRVGDTAMFCVELAKPEGPVQWLWNQKAVVAGGRVAVTAEGTCHTLTISRCSLEDVGEVAFVAGDCRTSTQFCVSGKGRESPCRTEGAPSLPAVHWALL